MALVIGNTNCLFNELQQQQKNSTVICLSEDFLCK